LVSKNQYTKFHENLRDVMCRPLPDFILDSLLIVYIPDFK
jgi:hypothetical protein